MVGWNSKMPPFPPMHCKTKSIDRQAREMRRPRLRCEAKEQTRFSSEQTTAADCFQKRENTDCEHSLWSASLPLKQQLPIESNRDKRENLQRPKDPDHSYINPCLIKEINLNQYIAENVLNWSGKCDQFCQRCFERTNGQTDRSLKSSLGWNLCFKQLWLDQDKGDLDLKLISTMFGSISSAGHSSY